MDGSLSTDHNGKKRSNGRCHRLKQLLINCQSLSSPCGSGAVVVDYYDDDGEDDQKYDCYTEALSLMIQGKFLNSLSLPFGEDVLNTGHRSLLREKEVLHLTSCDSEAYFAVGVSCLQLFVQINWTGPRIEDKQSLEKLSEICQTSKEVAIRYLSVDGDEPYEKIMCPELLALSRTLLSHIPDTPSSTWRIWQLRSVYVHQCILNEKSSSLKSQAMKCIESLQAEHLSNGDTEQCKTSALCWLLEAAYQARYYFEYKLCKELLEMAEQTSALKVNFTGVPGKRTKFQQKTLAQLVLTVNRVDAQEKTTLSAGASANAPLVVPKNIPLNDDTVLDRLNLADSAGTGDCSDNIQLSWVEQALIIAHCDQNCHVKQTDDDMTEEETLAFIRYVLDQPADWSMQSRALLIRSLVEKTSGRRMERSLAQLEDLSGLSASTGMPCAVERLRGAYTALLPPSFHVQSSVGQLHMDIGSYASALEVFERLQLWNPLIVCCQRAGRLGKAESIIRERLKVKETVPLLCSLADVTAEPEFYEKAWELSSHRSARAIRGLAMHYMRITDFPKAIECFDKALAINSLQVGCWFSCGCASLSSSLYEKAAQCFRRCVMINEDNFEGWNNLAAAYARNGQKSRAFAVLKDAIKCNFDNWKVWENYSLIGTDCGEFAEVIRSGHRIIELRGKWADEDVLRALTKSVIKGVIDSSKQSAARLKPLLLELFGHVTSAVTNNSAVWQLYGELLLSGENNSPEIKDRGVQCLQKAYRSEMNVASWEKDREKCFKNTELLIELVSAYQEEGSPKYASTARLQVKSHLTRLTKAYQDQVTKILPEGIQTLVNKLEDKLSELQTSMKT